MSNSSNPCETWISSTQAAALMHVSPSTVIRRINQGKLQGKPSTNMPFDSNGNPNYLILLEHLPLKAQHRYHLRQMDSSETLAIDLISPKETYGDLWLKKFLDLSALLSEAETIRREYRSSRIVTERLIALANSHGISLRTLYRYEGKRGFSDVSKLWLDPVYLSEHVPQSMCLLSCDFAYYLWLSPQHYSQNDILRELKSLAGKVSCAECVYCEANAEHKSFVQKMPYPLPTCRLSSEFMRIPSTRYPLNNLLFHIPSQQVCFCREGFRSWNAKYGHFIIRDKPMLVNLNWQGDHHVVDCFVRVKQMRTENGIRQEREVLVRPVLTAWMDTASGCIVGWVISIMPNASTIAEAFCRAVVYTYGDSFHGLPSSILVDCGKVYRSALLEDIPVDMENSIPEDSFLNRRWILPALNVSVYHALPYHPQSKSIERLFGTLESRWISKLPG